MHVLLVAHAFGGENITHSDVHVHSIFMPQSTPLKRKLKIISVAQHMLSYSSAARSRHPLSCLFIYINLHACGGLRDETVNLC